jgi:ATP-dependent DNA helicase RecG
MLRADLLELIRNGENSGVEFKEDTVETFDFAKEVVAFANFQGGQVLLGVSDDRQIVGITRDRLEEWVMNVCRDRIRPELIPFFEIVKDVEPGRDVAIVSVDRGWDAHAVWRNNHKTYYIRVGSTSREASTEELARLLQQRGTLRSELRPVVTATEKDLDFRRIKDYFENVRGQAIPADGDEDAWRRLLINTEFLVEDSGSVYPTVASVLLFGATPNKFLVYAGIEAAAYPGTEAEYAARERAQLRGPMVPLLGVSQDGSRSVTENGIPEQAIEFIHRNTAVTAEFADGGIRRSERRTFPDLVLREAIINALAHRDYLLTSMSVSIDIYSDRLEIISPGRLPNGVTPERMLDGIRATRNQLIMDTLRDYGYLEHSGLGVPRIMVRGMLEHNGTQPELIEDGERFIVRLLSQATG